MLTLTSALLELIHALKMLAVSTLLALLLVAVTKVSTVTDLSKWIETIQTDSFLTKELRESYFGKHISKRGGYYEYDLIYRGNR